MVAKNLVRALRVVIVDVRANTDARICDGVVGMQVAPFLLEEAPQALVDDVVHPAPMRDRDGGHALPILDM